MVQLLQAVLKMSVAESLTVRALLRNVFAMDASIANHVAPKRLVCISP